MTVNRSMLRLPIASHPRVSLCSAPRLRRLTQPPTASSPASFMGSGLPEAPDDAWVERDVERQKLVQALSFEAVRPVCLYGPVGRGKTALATEAARWLVREGACERAVYASLAGGLLPETISDALGVALLGPDFTLADGEAGSRLIATLADAPTMIIWDNVEAALSPDALAYGAEARTRLVSLARELAHVPGCRLLLLADAATCPAELAPLDVLAQEIPELAAPEAATLLRLHAAGAALTDEETSRLVTALGGNPLALRCAVTYLASHGVDDLLAAFDGLLPGAQTVSVAIELLLSALSPDDRLAVNALGLYARGYLEPLALRVTSLPADSWHQLKPILRAAGLLAEQHVEGLSIARLEPLPALQAHLARHVTPRQRQALASELAQAVLGLWGWLPRGEERAPGLTRRLARLELANLAAAVDLALAHGDLNLSVDLIQAAGPALSELGLAETLTALRQRLDRAASAAIPSDGPLSRPAVQFMLRQAEALLQGGRGEQSAALLQQLVQRITAEHGQSYPPPEAALDQGLALRLMATLLKASGRPELVAAVLRQAVAAFGQARGLPEARHAEALSWRELAETLLLGRQGEAAEEAARRGLDLAQRLQDLELSGGFESQLGAVAVLQGDAAGAIEHLQRAVEHLTAAQTWSTLSSVWGQIAAVHENAQQDLNAAREALSRGIKVAADAGLAPAHGQMLMQRARLHARLALSEEARADLEAAAGVYRAARLASPLLGALRALAELALEQERLAEAEVTAEEARQVGEAASGAAPWEIYYLLQRLAARREDAEAEAGWRARTQQAFARSAAAPAVLQQWFPLIRAVAESCRGTALSAETAELVERLEASPQGAELAGAIWAVLSGARGPEVYRDLDHAPAFVMRTILHAIDHPELLERPPAEASAADPTSPGAPGQVLRRDGA